MFLGQPANLLGESNISITWAIALSLFERKDVFREFTNRFACDE
jgi:hypothetical protein